MRRTTSMSANLNWPLGQYRITREIDRGQFGTVYEAVHLPREAAIALKLIVLDGPDSDEKVEAERQGAILQQRFSRAHPGLVPEVFEHLRIEPYYAVAMELVRGQSLTTLIAQAPIPPRRAAEIALAIATFLEKAHEFKTEIEGQTEIIVHADLKPAHVLLLGDGNIRVLDFGIAKALAARKPATTNKWGSVDYASPERLESGQVNEHVDFWSLGVILFEMVTGFRPYRQHEGSPSRLESAIRRQEPRTPLPAGVDPALSAIIHKLLAPQLERRYQTASTIAQDLTAFLAGRATVASAEAAQANQETTRIPSSSASRPVHVNSVATEPLPTRRAVPPPVTPAEAPARPAATRLRTPPSLLTTGLRAVAVIILVALVASEGIALVRAGRLRDDAPRLEVSDLATARAEFNRIDGAAPLGLGTMRVRGPLRDRMVDLANRTILEFRAEVPALARAQWEQSLDCLNFASEVAPDDDTVAAKRAYVQGRLAWIRSGGRSDVDNAIRLLRTAARLDPASPDPYLGLATIFAYSTRDLPALTQAIRDAEDRGYTSGRRERAELGDVHKVLADRARARAQSLTGEERVDLLQTAAGDYARCMEYFTGLHLGDSESNIAMCRTRLRGVSEELSRLTPPDAGTPDPPALPLLPPDGD